VTRGVTRKEKEEAALLTVLSIFIGAQVMEKGNGKGKGKGGTFGLQRRPERQVRQMSIKIQNKNKNAGISTGN